MHSNNQCSFITNSSANCSHIQNVVPVALWLRIIYFPDCLNLLLYMHFQWWRQLLCDSSNLSLIKLCRIFYKLEYENLASKKSLNFFHCIKTDFVTLSLSRLLFFVSSAADAGSCWGGPRCGLFHLWWQPSHDRCPQNALFPQSEEHQCR